MIFRKNKYINIENSRDERRKFETDRKKQKRKRKYSLKMKKFHPSILFLTSTELLKKRWEQLKWISRSMMVEVAHNVNARKSIANKGKPDLTIQSYVEICQDYLPISPPLDSSSRQHAGSSSAPLPLRVLLAHIIDSICHRDSSMQVLQIEKTYRYFIWHRVSRRWDGKTFQSKLIN